MRKKQYRKLAIAAACVCVVLLIGLAEHLFTGQLPVENVAGEWSKLEAMQQSLRSSQRMPV